MPVSTTIPPVTMGYIATAGKCAAPISCNTILNKPATIVAIILIVINKRRLGAVFVGNGTDVRLRNGTYTPSDTKENTAQNAAYIAEKL